MIRSVGAGLLAGVTWGAAARLWMHFLTDDPHFTWEGTLFILVITGVAGTALGIVRGARSSGRARAWRFTAILALPLFIGQGVPFAPAFLLGGFAVSDRGPRWVRGVCLLLVVAVTGWLFHALIVSEGPPGTTIPLVGYVLLSAAVALGGREIYQRAPVRRESSVPVQTPVVT